MRETTDSGNHPQHEFFQSLVRPKSHWTTLMHLEVVVRANDHRSRVAKHQHLLSIIVCFAWVIVQASQDTPVIFHRSAFHDRATPSVPRYSVGMLPAAHVGHRQSVLEQVRNAHRHSEVRWGAWARGSTTYNTRNTRLRHEHKKLAASWEPTVDNCRVSTTGAFYSTVWNLPTQENFVALIPNDELVVVVIPLRRSPLTLFAMYYLLFALQT